MRPLTVSLVAGIAPSEAPGTPGEENRVPLSNLEHEVERLRREIVRLQRYELVGRLASGVAHDVGNELGVVIGFASALQRNPSISDEGRLDLQTILEAAERAAALPARLQRLGRHPVNSVVVSLAPLLRSLEGCLRQVAGRKVQVTVESHGEGTVIMDPVALEQLILNMAMRVCDAMPDGGELTVRFRAIGRAWKTKGRTNDTGVEIEVCDTTPAGASESAWNSEASTEHLERNLGAVAQIVAEANGVLEVERSAAGTVLRARLPEATGTQPKVGAADLTVSERAPLAAFAGGSRT